eukprot:scaffold8531_cov62-Phaeocystis_antarctica.AAC.10
MAYAALAQASQRRPRIGHRVVGFERIRMLAQCSSKPTTRVNLAVQNGRGVRILGSRHRCQLLPAVGRRVVHIHTTRAHPLTFVVVDIAAQHVDLTVDPSCGVMAASHGQARCLTPRAGDGIVGLNYAAKTLVVLSADRIDLACYRHGRQETTRRRHARQRLPAVGLRVVHLRFSERHAPVASPAQDIELATQSNSAVTAAHSGHAGDLAPRIERRVVGPHRADHIPTLHGPAHQVDPARPEAQAPQRLHTTDDGRHRLGQHPLPCRGEQRRPRSDGVANEALRHRRKAHVLQDRHQLGLGPLGGLGPPHDPPEHRLLVLGHQHLLLHQRQHLRARGQLRRQLLKAAQRRRHGGLLERRQGEGLGDPPHLEGVVRR